MKANLNLKKWTQNDRHSLDLDNPNDLRDILIVYDFGMGSHNFNDLENYSLNEKGYHYRSASGESQYSVGSGQRAGSFLHPYQQTSRPFTPPYTNATVSSLDLLRANDLSGRLADEEVELRNYLYYTPKSNASSYRSQSLALPSPSCIPKAHIPTMNSSSRLALVNAHPSFSSQSKSNQSSSLNITTPQSSSSASTEKGFRLRIRSEVICRSRAQSIQEARRKFQEKKQVQDEKAAREEIKQLEKRQQKEAIRIERSNRQSSTNVSCRPKRSRSDATSHDASESFSIISIDTGSNHSLFKSEEKPELKRNGSLAKQKTHSAWAMFLMWFRMRLMHVGGKINCKS